MSKRLLYGDASEIEKLLSKMQLMEEAKNGLAAVYKDKESGAFWLKTYAIAEGHGGGYLILIRLPLPDTEALINVALSSEHEDELVAVVLRLLDEEKVEAKNFRHILISKIKANDLASLSSAAKERINKIIKLSRLEDATNRREILNKSKEEIQQDAAYFGSIADEAKELLQLLS